MKVNIVTLCSGYDSQTLACERLKRNFPNFDYELIAWVEFDPDSKQPIEKQPAVVAHNALFPQWLDRNMGRVYNPDGISPTINCCGGGDREPKIIQRAHGFNKGNAFNICPTITSSAWQDNNLLSLVESGEYRIRKLTPRECFRLMGLEDCDIDKIQSTGISNSQQYKLAGNSIVIPCLYHIFRKLFVETGNEKEQLTLF